MIYVDASALVKLILREDQSAALLSYLGAEPAPLIFTAHLSVTEVKRALHARGDTEQAEAVAAVPGRLDLPGQAIITRPVSAELLAAAGDLAPGTVLRSLDAIHLAVAMTAGAALTGVLTYDHRMAEAAGTLGLAVLAPG